MFGSFDQVEAVEEKVLHTAVEVSPGDDRFHRREAVGCSDAQL